MRSEAVPLGGVDLFHLRGHQEMRWRGLAGNVCTLVAELDGRVDERALAARVTRASRLVPELSWRLSRDVRLQPVWRRDRPAARGGEPIDGATRVTVRAVGSSVVAAAAARLDAPIDGRLPWHLEVLRSPTHDAVVLRWFHPLTDARGAARLLGWLGDEGAPAPEGARFAAAGQWLEGFDDRQRLELARRYSAHVDALARQPILSLHGARPGAAGRRHLIARRVLDAEQTAVFDRSVRRRARLADTSLLVYAGARALDRMLRAQGLAPVQQLIPLPLSLDPKQEAARLFGNNLTMMMLRLGRDELRDEAAAVASIAEQRRGIVRDKLDVAMLAALDWAGRLPGPLYSWLSRRPFGGERASLVVSHPGVVALDAVLGVPVRDAYTLPSVALPPGLQLIATRHRGRLSLVLGAIEGLVRQAELGQALRRIEQDLMGA